MGDWKRSEQDAKPSRTRTETLSGMDVEKVKRMSRKQGIFDDGVMVEETKPLSWLEKKHLQALKVLRRRANTEKKDKQREHVEKHGVDDATIERAEEVQVRRAPSLPRWSCPLPCYRRAAPTALTLWLCSV